MSWEKFPDYDILWCDPPWEQRMVNYFQTVMKRDTGVSVSHTIEEILQQLSRLANRSKPLYIEYSSKGFELVSMIMINAGHKLHGISKGIQTSGSGFNILYFNTDIAPVVKRKGMSIVTDTLCKYPRSLIIFDPFAGIGNTAKGINTIGDFYIGSEINSSRFKSLCKNNP